MIRFDEVGKEYAGGGASAVDRLTLDAPSRQITVFVGPSGCGKTTSLRMINRMTEPTSGRILIDGTDTARIRATELRRGIGYVIQQAGLFPNKTVAENVMTVPVLLGRTRREARARARELLEIIGLGPEYENRYPAQLSGGQQQRVGVARALAADPPILLMDEPFSAVDPVVRTQLQDELLRIQQSLPRTIVFVTHDIDEAIKLGDRIAVMQPGGRLAQYGTPSEILARPANAFVAGFVGRDRGYRALGFLGAAGLAVTAEPTIALGDPVGSVLDRTAGGWVLVLDADGRPQGWFDTASGRARDEPVTPAMLNLGGTLAADTGTLREALDAALSSPSGRGVVVHGDGRYSGTVRAAEVLERLGA